MKKLILVLLMVLSMGWAAAAVNINTATVQELTALPGIGTVKAQAIVEYRKKNGYFKTIEDLKKVKGIGNAVFEKLKSEATVGQASSSRRAVPAKK